MGATSGAGTAYPSGASEFTPGIGFGSCCSIFSFVDHCLSFVLLWITDSDWYLQTLLAETIVFFPFSQSSLLKQFVGHLGFLVEKKNFIKIVI